MANEYSSRAKRGLLAIPLAGLLGAAYGCAQIEVQNTPAAVSTATPSATPVCMDYGTARAQLLKALKVEPKLLSRPLYDATEKSGSVLPDGKKSRSFTLDDSYIVVSTQKKPSQLEVRMLPLPGKESFMIEKVPFSSISFENYDLSRDSFDHIAFTIIDPCTGTRIPSEHTLIGLNKIPLEDKLLANVLGRYVLSQTQRARP